MQIFNNIMKHFLLVFRSAKTIMVHLTSAKTGIIKKYLYFDKKEPLYRVRNINQDSHCGEQHRSFSKH